VKRRMLGSAVASAALVVGVSVAVLASQEPQVSANVLLSSYPVKSGPLTLVSAKTQNSLLVITLLVPSANAGFLTDVSDRVSLKVNGEKWPLVRWSIDSDHTGVQSSANHSVKLLLFFSERGPIAGEVVLECILPGQHPVFFRWHPPAGP